MGFTYRGHYILIVITAFFPITCFTSYTIAVLLDHVHALFPYISDTGTRAPESCVFGFFLGIYALLTARAIRLRYQQVYYHYGDSNRRALLILNKVAFITGWAAALGIYMVANFQETNVLAVHLIGAFLAFIVDKVLIFATIASKLQPDDPLKWGPGVKGYTEHVISTFLEWVVAFIATAFFLTFAKEFHKFEIKGEELNFLDIGSNFELNGKEENSVINEEIKY
ncbi:hypothetical protein LOTGIDRAFT_163286 [Lottia gigantea]|uniref:CWH43-like N-terminal domain-containing protein n=1 Tax=Lottia gigantea TaxID=225164 RepID=V4A4D5_LOTGI|nr:hypothetical protein LOTGIDRAFT_163286 [Lottia gigantea]ESO91562.1 hypothetical protein LOTGIDRAFT_163286 [Lottia gigantea]